MTDKLLITVAPCIPPALAAQLPGLDLSLAGIAACGRRTPSPSTLRELERLIPPVQLQTATPA